MATQKFNTPVIPLSRYRAELRHLFDNNEFAAAKALMELDDLVWDDQPPSPDPLAPSLHRQYITRDIDPNTDKPTLRLSVDTMVRQLVGEEYEVKVERENWQDKYASHPPPDHLDQIAIHLCRKKENPTGEVITLREPTSQFPSAEMRAKLELLRR